GDAMATIHSTGWPFGAGQSLQQVGELLFRSPKGDEIVFEDLEARGMIEYWRSTAMAAGSLASRFPKVAPAVIASVLASILAVVSWPSAAIIRLWRGRRWSEDVSARRCHLTVRLILLLQFVVIVVTCGMFAPATVNPAILSDTLDPALVALYACGW